MNATRNAPLLIYYDGLCHLCSAEMEHYRKRDGKGQLRFIDITAPGFDAAAGGLDPDAVLRMLHVRTPDGALHTAVDAFLRIWESTGWYPLLRRMLRWPWLRLIADLAYLAFASARPWMPRKACGDGYCDPLRRKR